MHHRCYLRVPTSRPPTPATCRRRPSRWTLDEAHPIRSTIVGMRPRRCRVTWLRLSQPGPRFGAMSRRPGGMRLSGIRRAGGPGQCLSGSRRSREGLGGARAASVVGFAFRQGGTQGTVRIPAAVRMSGRHRWQGTGEGAYTFDGRMDMHGSSIYINAAVIHHA